MTAGLVLRPSKREIDNRLKEATLAIRTNRVFFANHSKILGELNDLETTSPNELWDLLLSLLEEIKLDDYSGGHPPQKSYEPTIANLELWAFVWESSLLKKRMYLKFALKKGCLYYVSLHESKEPSRKVENELFKMRQ